MIRVPAVLVGLMYACVLAAAGYIVASETGQSQVLMFGLPIAALAGGFIAGRWAARPAPVPGLAVGIMILAIRAGLGMAAHGEMTAFINPTIALLELIAAIGGGVIGTTTARHVATEIAPKQQVRAI